jgi:hypothetical protein
MADGVPEDIGVITIVIPKLELSNVQMQIFFADLVISSNNATLQDGPEALNRIGVNCADYMLTNGVVNGLVREAVLQPHIAGISICAEKANAVRYGFSHESFKRLTVCILNNASNHVSLALDCPDNGSLARVAAPTLAAFLVPMPVFVAAANVGFVNLNDAAELLNIFDHGSSDLVAHKPSSFIGAEAQMPEDLEGAHALLDDQHKVRDSVPIFQRLIRVLKDCAGQVREAITCGAARSAYGTLPMMAGGEGVDLHVTAAGARNTLRPAAGHQIHNAIVLSFKQRVELGRCHLVDCFRAGHANSPSMEGIFA